MASSLFPGSAAAYEQYYGFVQSPFTLTPDPKFLYRSESHAEALALLLQALRRREGFIVLTGDIGTGKTTISRSLLQQLDANTFTSLLLNPFLTVDELLREALLDFGVLSREAMRSERVARATTQELVSTLHDFLLSLVPINGHAVLIIDEAQHLSADVLEQVRVLSNLETNESKLLQIVLVGQLNLLDSLAQADMRQLQQRVSQRAMLKPLTREEVEAYISHRLSVAKGSSEVTFRPAALDLVYEYSGGVPRVINMLCNRALMAGAKAGEHTITPKLVAEAAEALQLTPAPLAAAADTAPPATRPRHRTGLIVGAIAAVVLVAAMLIVKPLDSWVTVEIPVSPDAPAPRAAEPAGPLPVPPDDLVIPPPARAPRVIPDPSASGEPATPFP